MISRTQTRISLILMHQPEWNVCFLPYAIMRAGSSLYVVYPSQGEPLYYLQRFNSKIKRAYIRRYYKQKSTINLVILKQLYSVIQAVLRYRVNTKDSYYFQNIPKTIDHVREQRDKTFHTREREGDRERQSNNKNMISPKAKTAHTDTKLNNCAAYVQSY